MIKIDKNTMNAELVIGDTGSFSITPKINGVAYLSNGDEICMTVRRIKDGKKVLEKSITNFKDGMADIIIDSSDTINLEEDSYLYDLKSFRKDGTVDTLIPNAPSAILTLKRGVK